MPRYHPTPDGSLWKVVDAWTGETVVISLVPQDEMAEADADELAAMLNRRADAGAREVLQ